MGMEGMVVLVEGKASLEDANGWTADRSSMEAL